MPKIPNQSLAIRPDQNAKNPPKRLHIPDKVFPQF